jgi:carboxypeptidase C (cathepsin A)
MPFKDRIQGFFLFFLCLIFCLAASSGRAQEASLSSEKVPAPEEMAAPPENLSSLRIPREAVTTHHALSQGDLEISYDATVGYIPVYEERTKKEMGSIFYVAYTLETEKKDSLRPLTFVFNGGPGSPAIWLHMGAFAPVRGPIRGVKKPMPAPPYEVRENPWTLLPQTDLVFLDPLGTGYSLPPEESGEAKEFWGIGEDIRAMGEVIRMYLTRQRRWGSPVFLLGESYGGIRAAGLASALQDLGIAPSGIILIAPALDYGDILGNSTNERHLVHRIPTMALSARYHEKIDSPLAPEELWEKALSWSRETYLPALWKGNLLEKEEKIRIARELSALIGIPEEILLDWNLRVPQHVFAGELRNDLRSFLSLYDTRLIGPGGYYSYSEDPLMARITTPFATAFKRYLQEELLFVTDLTYVLSGHEAHKSWNWNSGLPHGKFGYPETLEDLATALRRDPHLRVFTAMGTYDLVCPPESIRYGLAHMDLPREIAERVLEFHQYPGGHMMYLDEENLERMQRDLENFYGNLTPSTERKR